MIIWTGNFSNATDNFGQTNWAKDPVIKGGKQQSKKEQNPDIVRFVIRIGEHMNKHLKFQLTNHLQKL